MLILITLNNHNSLNNNYSSSINNNNNNSRLQIIIKISNKTRLKSILAGQNKEAKIRNNQLSKINLTMKNQSSGNSILTNKIKYLIF